MATMTHSFSPGSGFCSDLTGILGLTTEFSGYITALVNGKELVNKNVKDLGGKVVISFTFCDQQKSLHQNSAPKALAMLWIKDLLPNPRKRSHPHV